MHSTDEPLGGNAALHHYKQQRTHTTNNTMADTLKIHLDIAGHKYPMMIERSKEELYRKAEKEVNAWVSTIESKYRMDKKECLAMVALQLALQNVERTTARNIDDDLEELTKLERTIDAHLAKL